MWNITANSERRETGKPGKPKLLTFTGKKTARISAFEHDIDCQKIRNIHTESLKIDKKNGDQS